MCSLIFSCVTVHGFLTTVLLPKTVYLKCCVYAKQWRKSSFYIEPEFQTECFSTNITNVHCKELVLTELSMYSNILCKVTLP